MDSHGRIPLQPLRYDPNGRVSPQTQPHPNQQYPPGYGPVTRASASMYSPLETFAGSFALPGEELGPSDFTILYDKATKLLHVHKSKLREHSRVLASATNGFCRTSSSCVPFLQLLESSSYSNQESQPRILRLRDFPFAIKAMILVIYDGFYSLPHIFPELTVRFPRVTELDFHVDCYLLGDKYDVAVLRDCAIQQYLEHVCNILGQDFRPLYCLQDRCTSPRKCGLEFSRHIWRPRPDCQPSNEALIFEDNTANMPFSHNDRALDAEMFRFINSLTLLWKKTYTANDPMRRSVLEIIGENINKLVRCEDFKRLLLAGDELSAFGQELENFMEEEGLGMQVEVHFEDQGHLGSGYTPMRFA